MGSADRGGPNVALLARSLRGYPGREFVPAPEPPVDDLPSRYALLSHPSAPSAAIRRALIESHQTREDRA